MIKIRKYFPFWSQTRVLLSDLYTFKTFANADEHDIDVRTHNFDKVCNQLTSTDFRMTRDVSARLKYQGKPYAKPSLIHALFLPALQGPGTKVCSSLPPGTQVVLTRCPDVGIYRRVCE